MSRRITFNGVDDGIWFEYCESAPDKFLPIGKAGRIHTTGLYLYGMYRNALYDSYKLKPDLAEDIRSYPKVFHENEVSALSANPLYNDPLYHYSVAGCLDAAKTWLNPGEKLKSYFAYQDVDGHKKIVGFVHFTETLINEGPVVYIAQAGVINRSKGVGRRLMECVLSHYPAGTHFNILTRVFNTEAKTLYEQRLHFSPIGEEEVRQLGYDKRYCGFEHTTSADEVSAIKGKQTQVAEHVPHSMPP